MIQNQKYLKTQFTIQLIANFIIGGLLAYLATKELSQVKLWLDTDNVTQTNISVDLIAGSFFMALILSLIYSYLTRKGIEKGELVPQLDHEIFSKIPRKFFKRSLVMGCLFLFSFGLLFISLFVLMGVDGLHPAQFVVLKALLSGAEAALVTYLVIKAELRA